jgi:hypothetical protein
MSSTVSQTPKRDALIGEAQGMLFDFPESAEGAPPEVPDIPEKVWEAVLPAALADYSPWYPLRRLAEVEVTAQSIDAVLPADFMSPDPDSFNAAVNPNGFVYSFSEVHFEIGLAQARPTNAMGSLDRFTGVPGSLGIYTPPYSPSPAASVGIPFSPGTRFDFTDDGQGGKKMLITPAAGTAGTLRFIYNALHKVTTTTNDQQQAVEVFTVPAESRQVLLYRLCQLALIAMARQLAGGEEEKSFKRLAGDFKEMFDEKTSKRLFIAG